MYIFLSLPKFKQSYESKISFNLDFQIYKFYTFDRPRSELTRLFNEEEITTWDCDCLKSPDSNGIDIGFIKDFCGDTKFDIMMFILEFQFLFFLYRNILEFHRNNKLAKGMNMNYTYISYNFESWEPSGLSYFSTHFSYRVHVSSAKLTPMKIESETFRRSILSDPKSILLD